MARVCALVLLTALLAAVVGANKSSFIGKCPINLGKHPFDAVKASGQWYIQAGTPLFGERLSRCPRFTITPHLRGAELFYDIKYNALSPADGTPYALESTTQAFTPLHGSLALGVWRRPGTQQYSEPFGQSIVASDYKSFAIFLACRPAYNATSGSFQRVLVGQVWGRQANIAPEARQALVEMLANYDIAPEDIQPADQNNCDYNY